MINLFQQAIDKHELLKFAIGEGEYYCVDSDYDEHSIIKSWINYILPLIEEKGIQYVNYWIELMFEELILNLDIEKIKLCNNLIYHLHTYYYLNSEKRIVAMNLTNLNTKILSLLNYHISNLDDVSKKIFNNTLEVIKKRGGLKISNI